VPQDLAALLVEEGAVSQADMERAVARQAQLGGALDTALLELELIGEGHLRSFLAHASGLPAVPPGALKEVDPRARRVFPAKVAERHRLAPFALDGRELSVVAAHPVDSSAVDEIGFMLSLTLVPHVGPEWQVLDLIHRLYGGQMPARLGRLAESEQQRAAVQPPVHEPPPAVEPEPAAEPPPAVEPEPAAAPPQRSVPPPLPKPSAPGAGAPPSLEEAFFAAGEAGEYEAQSVTDAPRVEWPAAPEPPPAAPEPQAAADETSFEGLDRTPPPESPPEEPETEPAVQPQEAASPEPAAPLSTSSAPADADETSFADIEPERRGPSGFSRDDAEPAEPLLAALELAVDAYDALWADKPVPPLAVSTEPSAAEEPPPPAEESPSTAPMAAAAPAEDAGADEEGEPEPERPPQLDRTAPPRWSIDDARATLATAVHRDEVVLTALRFARDFFEFSALFAVTRDAVVGHDALGPQEDAPLHARGTAIYADDPGIVRTVLQTGAPYLGPAVREATGTINILDGLWRGTPHTVLLYPILLGDRAVAVLYADNGEAPVSARRLGDLLLFLSTVGASFERIIRARKKRSRRSARGAQPVPPAPAGPEPVADPAANAGAMEEPGPSWMEPPPDEASASSAPPIPEAANEPVVEPESPSLSRAAGEGQGALVEEPAEEPSAATVAGGLPPEAPSLSPGGGEGTLGRAGGEPAVAAEPRPVEAALALLLAGGSGPPDPVAPIVDLLLDPDPEVAAAAREALCAHRGHAAVKPVPERLRRGLLSGIGGRPIRAAEALGALRDVESIPILIQAFEGGSPEAGRAAAEALSRITLQRLGPSAQKWLRWWKENRGRSRAEWLFAGLTSEDAGMREAASAELRAIAEPPVRYSPDMSTVELATASRAWWAWWARQGLRA
jgi:hypothetical protein